MDNQVNLNQANVTSTNYNQQYSSASNATIGINTQPITDSMAHASPQPMYGMPYQKSGGKKWSSCFIITVVLVLACCLCTVVLSVVGFSAAVPVLEDSKKLIVSELDKTVCDKSEADLSKTYRTKTLPEFRQNTTEVEFIEQAKKVSKICEYLESKSALDLFSQLTFFSGDGAYPFDSGVNTLILVSFNYDGSVVTIEMVGNTQEGFKIKTFTVD
jgi:hypothetical protein